MLFLMNKAHDLLANCSYFTFQSIGFLLPLQFKSKTLPYNHTNQGLFNNIFLFYFDKDFV